LYLSTACFINEIKALVPCIYVSHTINNMKKSILSFFVIFISAAYALSQHKGGAQEYVAAQPFSAGASTPPVQTPSVSAPTTLKLKKTTTTTDTVTSTATESTRSSKPFASVPAPTPVPPPAPTPTKPQGIYRNGTYTGSIADAYYGNIQVRAIITDGELSDIQFLQYPNDRKTSVYINSQAMPILKSEAISAQSANVDIVSGATDSSMAFQESLGSALAQAKN
jgi:uncharacterized protein with FMN-binding domain